MIARHLFRTTAGVSIAISAAATTLWGLSFQNVSIAYHVNHDENVGKNWNLPRRSIYGIYDGHFVAWHIGYNGPEVIDHDVNLAFVPLLGLGVCAAAGASLRITWKRAASGTCACCNYNLTGNTSGVCPECGTAVPHPADTPL